MLLFLSCGALILSPWIVKGHGSDLALTNRVGKYNIDVHYPYPFQENEPIWLNFFLDEGESDKSVPFTDLDVIIQQENEVILKTNISRKIKIATGAIVTFPNSGNYRINLTFNDSDTQMAQTSFDIEVAKRARALKKFYGVELNKELAIGILLGSALTAVLVRHHYLNDRSKK